MGPSCTPPPCPLRWNTRDEITPAKQLTFSSSTHRSLPRAPVHELLARVALHGEGDHHPNTDLLLGIALQPGDLLGIEVRREVLVEHLAFTHGRRSAIASKTIKTSTYGKICE